MKTGPDCDEWIYGKCVPNSGDCGMGVREATCNDVTKKLKCKVPCNWKKDFGGICLRNVPNSNSSLVA